MKTVSIFVFICFATSSFAQTNKADSSAAHSEHSAWRRIYRTPTILVGLSLVAMTDNEVFDKWEVREERNKIAPTFRTHVDNYLQFAPIAGVYVLNAMGVYGKNRFLDRTAILIKSELLTNGIVFSLKKATGVMRPDGSTHDSFPSGHTAQVFIAATFLQHEFGEDYPVVSVLGYVTASSVGVLRILNNRHWLSDVLAGAGLGILSSNIIYATHRHRWSKLSRVQVSPTYYQGCSGLYFKMNL